MYADTSGKEVITLRAVDTDRSRGFYQDLFGLVAQDGAADEGLVLSMPPGSGETFGLRLVPRGDGGGPDELWLSVEVQSITEVLDLYLLAIMIGAHATLPRKRADRWNTVVTDPDGHHISIWTSVPRDAGGRAPVRRSPRWEWERAQRPGYSAGEERSRARPAEAERSGPGIHERRSRIDQGSQASSFRRRDDLRGAYARGAGAAEGG
jgi:hypothetical protein